MWIKRIGNMYVKQANSWYPLYCVNPEYVTDARWLDDAELEHYTSDASSEVFIENERFLVECLSISTGIGARRIALIAKLAEGFSLGD